MKLLSIHVEIHNAFWLFFKPKLVKFIDKVTIKLMKVFHRWYTRNKVVEMKLQSFTLQQAISHLGKVDSNLILDDLNGKESGELHWYNFH